MGMLVHSNIGRFVKNYLLCFGEYVSNVSAPSISSEMAGQATQETEEQYANEGSLSMMQVCYFFIILF